MSNEWTPFTFFWSLIADIEQYIYLVVRLAAVY